MRPRESISNHLWAGDAGHFAWIGAMLFVLSAVAVLMVLRLIADLVLAGLNRAEVRRHASAPPPAVAAIMDAPTYSQSVAYTLEKSRFGVVTEIFDTLVLALVLFGGVLPILYSEMVGWGGPDSIWTRVMFVLLTGVLLGIPSLPFEWWEQFRLEQKFGFNKSTPGLWISDKIKGVILMFVIGFPLLWALLWLVGWAGPTWW